MTVLLKDDFAGGAAVLADPPWKQGALDATTLNRDGSGNAKASAGNPANDEFAYDDSNTYPADQWAEITVGGGLSVGNNYAEALVRASGSGGTFQGYSFNTDGGSGALHTVITKWSAGAGADITNFATTFTTGDKLRVEIVGNTLTCYKNGVNLGSFTDSTSPISSGAPGCGVYNASGNTVLISDFAGGDFHQQPLPKTVKGRRRRNKTGRVAKISGATRAAPVVTRVVRGRQIIVPKKKRHSAQKKGKTTLVKRARLAAQPAPIPPRFKQTKVLKKKRHNAQKKGKTTLVKRARLAAQPTPVPPRFKQTKVFKKKRRPDRVGRSTIIKRARLAITPPPSKPLKPATVVQRPKRRVRQGITKILTAVITSPAVLLKPAISQIEGRRRRKRTGDVQVLTGARRASVAAPTKKKSATVVTAKKRRRRVGSVEILSSRMLFTAVPRKSVTTVLAKKRRKRSGSARQLAAKKITSVVQKPSKTIQIVQIKKRRRRSGDVQQLVAKRSVTPVSVVPKAPMTVSLKRKHRKLQGKTTQIRAKRAGNQPITPPRPPMIIDGRRRRRRTGSVEQISGARRAPIQARKPVKQILTVLPKKRRKKRIGSTIRVVGARRFVPPAVVPRKRPTIVRRPKARKQISRKKTIVLLRALFGSKFPKYTTFITCYSAPKIIVLDFSGPKMNVTNLSNSKITISRVKR
jgi:hypothetical protein